MVLDRQKVRTDGRPKGRPEWTDGRTHGRRQNYIPLTFLGDNKTEYSKVQLTLIILGHECKNEVKKYELLQMQLSAFIRMSYQCGQKYVRL